MTEKFQAKMNRLAKEKMDFIAANQEKLIAAWVAETGCLPSEAILVIEQKNGRDISQNRCFIEKKADRGRLEKLEVVVERARRVRGMRADNPFRESVLRAFDIAIIELDALPTEVKIDEISG